MEDFRGFDRCLTAFGVVAGAGVSADGSDIDLEFDIPPVDYEGKRGFEDYDPPNILIKDDVNNHQWAAGGNYEWMTDPPTSDESRIVSYESEGGVASGTATFIDITALSDFQFRGNAGDERPRPRNGTFEIHCGA